MRKYLSAVAVIMLAASMSAPAQSPSTVRYKWHDSDGLAHFSDSLSAEAMKYGYDVVNDRGMVIQHVARQLNPEERAAANKLAIQQAALQRAAKEKADAEAQMLEAYPDEESYRISQQQALDTIDQQIRTTKINLSSQEKALTDLLSRAAEIERAKEPVPPFLLNSIANQRNVVTGQRSTLERQQAERAQTVQLQARQLLRYRELRAAQKQPAD
jgi:hypothetical protein